MGTIFVDNHIHTENSPDAHHSAIEMCERAVAKGVAVVTICDHCDLSNNASSNIDYYKRTVQSLFDARRASNIFKERMEVLAGIELGQPLHDLTFTNKLLSHLKFDYVLGSLHNNKGLEDYFYLNYDDIAKIPALMEDYFIELLEMVQWGRFDSLAHLNYPFRYIIGVHKKPILQQSYDEQFRLVLKSLAEKGIGLEINTSGLRQQLRETMPAFKYIQWFKELGGEIITIGSDAHNKNDVGAGILQGYNIAQEAGFSYITYFKNREPHHVKLK